MSGVLGACGAVLLLCSAVIAEACTSAIVGARATRDGRMMLWKHRDSGHPDNFVGKVEATDSTFAYVALFNAGDDAMEEAWIGFNSAGFAVMNTASYNLAPDTAAVKDREGLVMSAALKRCCTIKDFERLLEAEIACGTLGVQANFGVTDAEGGAAYFETSDHAFRCYPLAGEEHPLSVRSNYSYSGGEVGRFGETRHDNAVHLLAGELAPGSVTPETFTEGLSRSFYHHGRGENMADGRFRVLTDRGEYIPRRSSCASVVIESALPGENAAESTVMWVAIGFPAASHVEAVTLDSIPLSLQPVAPKGHSPLCDEVNRRRAKAFPRKGKEGKWLVDVGYLRSVTPVCRAVSEKKYREGRARRAKRALTTNGMKRY